MDNNTLREEIFKKMIDEFIESMETDQKEHPKDSNSQHLAFAVLRAMDLTFKGCCDYIDQIISLNH